MAKRPATPRRVNTATCIHGRKGHDPHLAATQRGALGQARLVSHGCLAPHILDKTPIRRLSLAPTSQTEAITVLAQLADIFEESTWSAVFVICLGAPLLGFIIGWILIGYRYLRTRWKWIAGYYAIVLALWALAAYMTGVKGQTSVLPACSILIVMVWGPILGVLFTFPPKGPRYPEGHCQTCGYNLTGNVSGRCSECGTDVNHQVKQNEADRQRARTRVPWVLAGLAIVMTILLPVATLGGSSFLLGFWVFLLLILLPTTILAFLRSK